jgi:23S rRNA (cytosine1962-C5)-methyltransferase
MSFPICKLKKGRERSLLNRHPWIFSGALASEPEDVTPGQLVDIVGAGGDFLARGYINPSSQIRVRVLTFIDEPIDTAFFANRLRNAAKWRYPLLPENTDSYRVCNSEGDFLPGLIVDRYKDYFVAQFLTTGIEAFKGKITEALVDIFKPAGVYEKSQSGSRKEEGLDQVDGTVFGIAPPDELKITEMGLEFYVDIKHGQKTGFFLDQRKGRHMARQFAEGRTVLNCFGYTGAYTVACLAGGAKRVVTVETSKPAIEEAKRNVALNGFEVRDEDFVVQDVFQYLRDTKVESDFIVLDPPAFAKSRAAVQRASRGYKDINFNAIRKLGSDGLLMTYSCSGHVSPDLFQKILFGAASDASKQFQILTKIGYDIDHPVNVYHPEGEYLTGALCHVGDAI